LTLVDQALRGRAKDKGLDFRVERPAHLPDQVYGDERRLHQVLMNLVDNAIKYTRRGGVTLRVSKRDGHLRFEVEDTGIGIHTEHLSAVFDSFQQVRVSGSFQEGAGLGLAISHRLVQLMGGMLEVESQQGAGSRFWFDLSLPEPEASETHSEPAQPPLIAVNGEGRRLLIADDREDNRDLLREMLAPQGFDLREVGDGKACLREASVWKPDAILVDLKMPVLDGEAVIRRIRATESLRDTVLIAVSASVFGHHREQCIEAGADAFLPKPFRREVLLDLLHRHLGVEPIFAPAETAAPQNDDKRPAAPQPLPRNLWLSLTELARRGDIQQLGQQAQRLRELGNGYGPFAAELTALVERFQMRRIRELLERTPHLP
jgi:CheY-like chemotaxis protein